MTTPSGHGDDTYSVRLLATASAESFDMADDRRGEELLAALIGLYVRQLALPLTRAWTSLPALDGLLDDMATTYSLSGMRGRHEIAAFRHGVSQGFAGAFSHAVPALAYLAGDDGVGLTAVQLATTELMRDRDRADARSEREGSGLVGRLMTRFAPSRSVDTGHDFMALASGECVRHAIAAAARSIGEMAVIGTGRGRSLDELDYLVELAEGHPAESSDRVRAAIDEARSLSNRLHVENGASLSAVSPTRMLLGR